MFYSITLAKPLGLGNFCLSLLMYPLVGIALGVLGSATLGYGVASGTFGLSPPPTSCLFSGLLSPNLVLAGTYFRG